MLRLLPLSLSLLLVLSGCFTAQPLMGLDLRNQLRAGDKPLIIRSADGASARVDPNTELRFLLRSGGITPWIQGRHLWRSDLGLSFEEGKGVFFMPWDDVVGVEARNLSGGKTFGAVLLAVVIVGVAVILIAASLKGGGPGGSNISGGRGKKKQGTSGFGSRPRARLRTLPRVRAGVHLHVPLIILTHPGGRHDTPPPPPPPPPPVPAPAPAPQPEGEVVEINSPGPAAPARPAAVAPAPRPAEQLFSGRIRRSSQIEFWGAVAAGTELARFEGHTASAVLGLRLRETVELGGGVRHATAPLAQSAGGDLRSSVVGFGRVNMHLWLDDNHRVALPIGVDVGAGYRAQVQLRLNLGLRVRLVSNLWLGLLPFNPSFTYYDEESEYRGAKRWTFPTTLEVGFAL